MVFTILLLAGFIFLGRYKNHKAKILQQSLDGLLFFCIGLLGFILLFMWFNTDHSMTKDNYNLLWAWPTHLVAAFIIKSRKKAVRVYWLITALLMILVLAAWYFLPQSMNPALIPVVLLLLYRSAMIYNH